MPVTAPPRGAAALLANRQANPLTGLEIKEAVGKHIFSLVYKLLNNADLLSDRIIELTESTSINVQQELSKHNLLQKINLTYPKVGWSIKVRLEEVDDGSHFISGEIELDLQRNERLNIRFGESGHGRVIGSLEEEKIPTSIPDKDRKSFDLPIQVDHIKPDGTVGKIDIRDLKGEKRAARTVDVGSGATERQVIRVHGDNPDNLRRVEASLIGKGELIITPDQLEISLDDIVATPPPPPPKEPLKEPLAHPNAMNRVKRPDVKFKR